MPESPLTPAREMTSRLYDYIPGNGSLYKLIVTDAFHGAFVLTWTNSVTGGRAATLRWDSLPPHPAYLAEKLGLHPESGDVRALCQFLDQLKEV
jgi:hypothetical protein